VGLSVKSRAFVGQITVLVGQITCRPSVKSRAYSTLRKLKQTIPLAEVAWQGAISIALACGSNQNYFRDTPFYRDFEILINGPTRRLYLKFDVEGVQSKKIAL